MSDYERTTTATTYAGLPEPLAAALALRAEAAGMTVAADAPAFVTHSTRLRRPGRLARRLGADRDPAHDTAMVIGARDLLVATSGEHRGTHVLSCRLQDAEIVTSVVPEDEGVSVRGFHVGGPDGGVGAYFIGLGEPQRARARERLREAIRAARAV